MLLRGVWLKRVMNGLFGIYTGIDMGIVACFDLWRV